MRRNPVYRKLITSPRWRETRAKKLQSAPLCEDCKAAGLITAACEVHHIMPVEWQITPAKMEQAMFDQSNLASLCHECHVRRHKELGSHSRKHIEKNQRQKLKDWMSRYYGE